MATLARPAPSRAGAIVVCEGYTMKLFLKPGACSLSPHIVLEELGLRYETELHKTFSPLFNPAAPQEWKEVCRASIERRLGYVNEQLAGRDYLMGADFSVADAYLFTVVGWTRFVKIVISGHANLTAYMARVAARPGVQAAMKAEGLV